MAMLTDSESEKAILAAQLEGTFPLGTISKSTKKFQLVFLDQ